MGQIPQHLESQLSDAAELLPGVGQLWPRACAVCPMCCQWGMWGGHQPQQTTLSDFRYRSLLTTVFSAESVAMIGNLRRMANICLHCKLYKETALVISPCLMALRKGTGEKSLKSGSISTPLELMLILKCLW